MRFSDLIKGMVLSNDEESFSAYEESRLRVIKQLPLLIENSPFFNYNSEDFDSTKGNKILLLVASYSKIDLEILDKLSDFLEGSPSKDIRIFVDDLIKYDTEEKLEKSIPGIGKIIQSPAAGYWQGGILEKKAIGHRVRMLIEEVLSLSKNFWTS